ncbi:MAG: hypothetical protein POELPBGB_02952 [Bacteroidia bacterium]|nr:hypothetical protein [Bacteroidia bacterium]
MKSSWFNIHPYSRLFILFLTIVGAFLADTLLKTFTGYFIVCMYLIFNGDFKLHFKMVLISGLPFFLMLTLVYFIILKNNPVGKFETGLQYSLFVFFRIYTITAIFQLIFNVSTKSLMVILKKWNIRGSVLILFIGIYSVWKDFKIRANRIIEARLSKGYFVNRSFIERIKHIPYLIIPIFSGTLSMAFDRSKNWTQLDLVEELNFLVEESAIDIQFNFIQTWIFPIPFIAWIIFNIL